MEQRNLGRSGLLVSVVGLGCNNFGGRIDFEATREVVHKALDLGITFFDDADTYGDPRGGSEAYLGQILGDRRKDIVLATKFARPMDAAGRLQGASRRYIMAEVEASLQTAQDRLDRPLPAAPARPADPDRGDVARARRSRAPGQGPLHRLLDPAGLAGRRGAVDLEASRPRTISSRARRTTACSRATSTAT